MAETQTSIEAPGGATSLERPAVHVASQFRGRGEYSLDDKGRLTLPSQMRKALRDGGNLVVLDGRAVIWDERTYRDAVDELQRRVGEADLTAGELRTFLSLTHPVALDAQGRIVVPASVRIEAGLDREVLVLGAGPRIELLPAGAGLLEQAASVPDDVVSILDAALF